MTPCRRVPNDQLATLKQHGGRRRRPSGLWSICVSGDRCGDAVGFSLSKGGNATDAGKREGIGRKSRGNSCQRKHPAEILALGPSCASHRRSLNANSLCGQNSAGSRESERAFKGIFCDDISEFESYHLSQPVRSPPPPMPRPLKTARHRGILQTSLSLRVRKVAADAPFQRLVSEAYFWRLVFDGWRTNSSASYAPFLPRFQLIDYSVISREQSFSRKDESVRQCVQLACTVRQLGLAYAQAQAGGQDPRADRPKAFTAQRSCRRR